MKKNIRKMLSLLLALMIVFQFCGNLAMADDADVTVTGNEALVYELRMTDPEDKDKTIPVSAEEEAEKLGGKTCAVEIGKADRSDDDEKNTALSRSAGSIVLEDLLKKDLIVTPPEGFYVSRAYLRGDAVETQKIELLPFTADAEKTVLVLKAGALGGEKLDKDYFTTLSTVDPQIYTLVLVLSPLEKEQALTVTEALEKGAAGTETQVQPGNSYTAPDAPSDTETRKFSGWQLSYKNGATLSLQPGRTIKPYADCRLEAQWIEIITVTANDPVKSGDDYAANGCSVSGRLAEGDSVVSVSLTVIEQDGGFLVVPSDAVIKNGEDDVTSGYVLRYVNSGLVLPEADADPTPASEPVSITVIAYEPVLNAEGTGFQQNGAGYSGTLNEGDQFASFAIDVRQNDDGSFVAVPRDAVIKNGDVDVTANYAITYQASAPVTLPEKEKVKITVIAYEPVLNAEGTGFQQNGAGYSGTLNPGDQFASYAIEIKQNEDGSFIAVPSAAVIKNGDTDVTGNYEISYQASAPVTLPEKEKVKITVIAKEPVLNDEGTAFLQNGATYTGTLNEGDQFASYAIEIKQNEDGSYVAVPSAAVIKNGDTDVTSDYEISYQASARVTFPEKIKITITAKPPVPNEDGGYKQDGAEITSGTLSEGDQVTGLSIEIKQNEDGSYVAIPSAAVIKNGDTDVTTRYEVTYAPSQAVMPDAEKIAITIRSKDRTAEYSGKPITADAYELVSGSLAEGDTIEVKYEGGSTNVTSSPVASPIVSVVIKDALGADVTDKYAVTIDNNNPGKVTVTKRPVTVTAISGSLETDGTRDIYAKDCKTANGVFTKGHKVEGLLEGHELRGDFVKGHGTETFTTSIDLNELRIVETATNTDVTANYEITAVSGTMTIKVSSRTGLPVAITVSNQELTYNGAAQRPDQTKYAISGLQDGDVATVTLQLKQGENQMESATNAGTYSIVPVVVIKDKSGNAVPSGKYIINAGSATLTVKKLDITLEAVSDTKAYDGKALVNDKVKAPSLPGGDKYSGVKLNVYDNKGNLIRNGVKEVGTYTKKITEVSIVDAKGTDVTSNYNITKVDGKLTITPSSMNDSTSPKTGDNDNTLYVVLLIASVLLLGSIVAFLVIQNRRKKLLNQAELEEDFDETEVYETKKKDRR